MDYAVYYFEKNKEIRIQSMTFYPDGDFGVSIFKRNDGKGYSFNKWETYGISSSNESENL